MSTTHRPNARVGAMTLAMRAAQDHNAQKKVLRIGVVHNQRVVDERVFSKPCEVSLGTTEKNTFTIFADGLPSRTQIFSIEDNAYTLLVHKGMTGRVTTQHGVRTIDELIRSGVAKKQGDSDVYSVVLDEHSRGKVTLGQVSLLFQFVVAPPVAARPQLPSSIRTAPLRSLDWRFNACLAAFVALAFSGFSYVEYAYDPLVEDNNDDMVRIVQLTAPPQIDDTPTPVDSMPSDTTEQAAASDNTNNTNNQSTTTPNTQNQPSGNSRPTGNHTPRPNSINDQIAAAMRAGEASLSAVRNTDRSFTALRGAANTGPSAPDTMFASPMNGGVDALRNSQNITTNGTPARNHGNNPTPTGLPQLGTPQQCVANCGQPPVLASREPVNERRITTAPAHVTPNLPEDPNNDVEIDGARVAAAVRRNMTAIRMCYEGASGLMRDPNLRGRLSVSFGIGTSGRTVGSVSASGLSNAPGVGQCVEGVIRRTMFPSAQEGVARFQFSFMFEPGH